MIFFLDENFIPKVGLILRAYEDRNQIFLFTDKFQKGTPDVNWIQNAGTWQPKPIIVGGDGRILRNDVERRILRESGCAYLYLSPGWTNTPVHPYAWKMLKFWPDVINHLHDLNRQAVVELSTNGKLRRYSLPA